MADEPKIERGRRSPSHSLEAAIGFLQEIQKNLGDIPSSRESLARALGHESVSGPASSKVGSLTHFGLLDRTGNVYRISSRGKAILFPRAEDERIGAVREAAKSPSLYVDLCQHYSGKALPKLLNNVLIMNHGVASNNADEVARLFTETMTYAGLLREGVLGAQADQETPSDDPARQVANQSRTQGGLAANLQDSFSAGDSFSIPISNARVARLVIPRPIRAVDFNRILAWMDLMKEALIEEPDVSVN